MEDRSEYYKYKKGDVVYEDCLCAFCKHYDQDNHNICFKYPNGKPEEVINNEKRCELLMIKDL